MRCGGVPHPLDPSPYKSGPNFASCLRPIKNLFSGAFSANSFRPNIFFSASKNSAPLGGGGGVSTAPAHQLLGSANAETTPAGAPAAAADRPQRPDATCEGRNG